MPEVEVKYATTAEFFAVAIDMKKLRFVNGAATRKLEAGQHALQWFVRGSPGAQYTIQITSPRPARFTHAATLDRDMKDAGVHWFALGSGG